MNTGDNSYRMWSLLYVNATLEAAEVMLEVIKESKRDVSFKAAGGVKDADTFIGSLADGSEFNDVGSNTLGHIAQQCAAGEANKGRNGLLKIPNLNQLGYGRACAESSNDFPAGLDESIEPIAAYGYAKEISTGKDTPSGHWEITGAPVLFEWGYFIC